MKSDGKDSPAWVRLSGIGFEFAAAVAGLALLGYWVDRHFGSSPWGLLIGLGLGLLGGCYNLVRESLFASRQAGAEWKERHERAAPEDDSR